MAKKRRRRARDRDRGSGSTVDDATAAASSPTRRGRDDSSVRMPSATARWTGFMIALVTAFLGGLTIWDGASSGGAGADVLLKAVAGILLIALGIVVAGLSIAPERAVEVVRRLRHRG